MDMVRYLFRVTMMEILYRFTQLVEVRVVTVRPGSAVVKRTS